MSVSYGPLSPTLWLRMLAKGLGVDGDTKKERWEGETRKESGERETEKEPGEGGTGEER